MVKDVKGIVRVIRGFSKIPNKNGNFFLEVEYELKPIDISLLRKWFNVSESDEAIVADLMQEIEINAEQAQKFLPYLVSEKLDLEKYDFYLSSYQAPGYEEYWKTPHAREYEEK